MNKYRLILIGVPCGLVLAGTIWTLQQPPEPAYHGRPLVYWLEHFFPPSAYISGGTSSPEAVEAICQIGTNGIPTLLRLAAAHDSTLTLKLVALAAKQHLIRVPFTSAWEKNRLATLGFSALGAAASNAVPALIRILDAKSSPWSQEAAAYALGSIGPAARQAVPSLCSALASPLGQVRMAFVMALGRIHAEPGRAIPALTKSLTDSDQSVRQYATEALGRFGADAQPAVPALIALCDQHTAESLHAATALGLMGPAAKAAVPSLLRGSVDTNLDLEFRRLCILALGRIHAEPELVVPALMRSLREAASDTEVQIQLFSANALGQFGPEARLAVPLLAALLQDPHSYIRFHASNALQLIESSPAAGAGTK
jgi:HEAT repeat protein